MNDVQVLAAVVNERRGKLYRTVNGSREPLYSASIMAEKLAEIAAFERAELERIVEEHSERSTAAAAELAQMDNPYSWLRGDEWPQAAGMSAFIAADVAGLANASAVAKYVDRMADAGRVPSWLAYWHAQRRLAEFDHSIFTPTAEQALANAADRLRPALERDLRQAAADDLRDAQEQIKAAERVLDAESAAQRLGVPGYVTEVRKREGFTE